MHIDYHQQYANVNSITAQTCFLSASRCEGSLQWLSELVFLLS